MVISVFALATIYSFSGKNSKIKDELQGAWRMQDGATEHVLLFQDGYFSHTTYSQKEKKFLKTYGGTYKIEGKEAVVNSEFDTEQKDNVSNSMRFAFTITGKQLSLQTTGKKGIWQRIDDSSAPLAGMWRITQRMQGDNLTPIHQTGTRKTLKILTGTRFQWVAIDPGKKEFFGTGGGTYTFANGKYVEHIEFFSRDSSRIGASLSFDDKLEEGKWHHTGLSSRGEKIYEVWEKIN